MKIAIDISPINDQSKISHRVRGVGFYLTHLKESLLKYFPDNDYVFFNRGEEIESSVDLVHYPYFDPFFLTLPFFEKKKRVITVHDLTPLIFPQNFPVGVRGNFKWQIQKLNLLKSERVITDSVSSQNDIVKLTGIEKSKIDVAYLAAGEEFGITEDSKQKNKIRSKYNLPDKFALYVGDVTWNKNLPKLIKAISDTNIPLTMVGSAINNEEFDHTNPWNQDLQEAQRLIGQNDRINRLGFVPTEDLITIYNMATIFTMPSLYEGFGLPILEAMQSGCPVLTSKTGSIPEVAGDAAYYVNAKDEKSISDGIRELFENTKLQNQLSVKGLAQAKKFSWQKTAEKTLESYRQALKI